MKFFIEDNSLVVEKVFHTCRVQTLWVCDCCHVPSSYLGLGHNKNNPILTATLIAFAELLHLNGWHMKMHEGVKSVLIPDQTKSFTTWLGFAQFLDEL